MILEFAMPINDWNLWKSIYIRKVKNINDNKIAEFNYNMLHNVLCNNAYLIKWTKDNGDNCTLCRTIENSKHLSFDCKNVEYIWKKTKTLFIYWFKKETYRFRLLFRKKYKIESLNILISFTAYNIFKYKMNCRI